MGKGAKKKVQKKPSSKGKVKGTEKSKTEGVKLDPNAAEKNKKQLELALALPKVVSLKPGSKETIASSKLTAAKAAQIKDKVLALAKASSEQKTQVESESKQGQKTSQGNTNEKKEKEEKSGSEKNEKGANAKPCG